MPRPSNTVARRAQIVDALLAVMAVEGYDGASISKIAKQANLRPGLIHYHFADKREILAQLVERLQAIWTERYEARLQRAGAEPMARLFAFIDAHVALGKDADASVVSAWVLVAAEAVRKPEIREVYGASVRERQLLLTKLLRAVLTERGISTRGVSKTSAALLSAIEGSFLLSAAAPEALPNGYAAPALRALVESHVRQVVR